MPTFVEIAPDPFATQFRNETVGDPTEDGSYNPSKALLDRDFSHVRRPVRGIQIKDDTHATIQVRTASGKVIPLLDAGGKEDVTGFGYSEKYSNFILQTMQEERSEKAQVVETFGEPFIFFFGENPRIISGTGILVNTEDFNWRAEFWENYNRYLRGTKCVQNKTRVTLSWDDIVVEGYFMKAMASESSREPNYVTFNFQMFLTNYQNVSPIGYTEFPTASRDEVNIDPLNMDTTGEGIGNLKSQTQVVRQLNLNSATLGVKNSLMESLREGMSAVVNFNGKLNSIFAMADRFLSGRNVRVPLSVTGGHFYDQETQISLASVDPYARQVLLRGTLSGQDFYISGRTGTKSTPRAFGKFRDNLDEYISRPLETMGSPINPADLFEDQKIDGEDSKNIDQKVKDVFRDYGVDTDPPNEAVLAASRLAFGLFQVGVGSVAEAAGVSSLRKYTNAII